MGKVVYFKNYKNKRKGDLEGKIVVGSDIQPGQAVDLAIENKNLQVVVEEQREDFAVKIHDQIDDFFVNPHKFMVQVNDEAFDSHTVTFQSETSKTEFLEKLEAFLSSPKYRRVRDDLYLIADELFTNFTRTALDKKGDMSFRIDADDERIMICCRDPFGTLDPKTMLNNVKRCFDQGVRKSIKMGAEGGAGIGSYLMYNVSEGMIIAVQPGQQTLVLLWMPKLGHHEDRIEMQKDLYIIRHEED